MNTKYGRAAWIVWGVGLFAYAVGIMHRTSLGVAGLEAADHFNTTPGIVSTFVVLQLATYALAQVPLGVLLDRHGSRVLIVAGSLVMAAGQALLALADDLPLAFAARILLGLGDACMFNSVLRLLPRWFEPRVVPLLSQITGMSASFGQIASVAAVLPLIHLAGWQTGLLITAGIGILPAVLAPAWIQNQPPGTEPNVVSDTLREIPGKMMGVTRHPATQLGFWIHFTSGFSSTAFVFMWGMPDLIVGQGLSPVEAGGLFSLLAIASMVAGPIIGILTARHPLRRSTLALILITFVISCWALVLLWPGRAPAPVLFLLIAAMAVAGPGTGIGFDYPRTSLPTARLGAANGIVITGSFIGGTVLVLVMGVFLDTVADGRAYTPDHLRLAWALQLPFYAVGLVGIMLARRKMRRLLEAQGVVIPTWREVVERIRRRRASE